MALDGMWVTGPALIYTYTGANNAQSLLGYCQAGADIEITRNFREVMTDVSGPMTPADLQDFGMVATITCPLITLDRTVLNTVLSRGNAGAMGQLNTPGRFVGASGDAFSVGIAAAADTPWKFGTCVVRPARFPMSVEARPFTLTFFAWPYLAYTATSGLNTTLYTRSL